MEKFGPGLGEEVWEATNKVFDVMPIAAVIDHKVDLADMLTSVNTSSSPFLL